ncbi:zinc finger BED domain-containing protein RICESLEEPER 2-like [Zingiber officinale]|uniref:zinc finger BED domain-containing protein RICESLEEPER 2-like n=1 Tax=Zingiber officinale TaxID=94328 RepID=UPI001C4B0CE6|nr:zinc finger BED domain-containing protein RICESLEEPER 2-like [Zingiber officinale]
MGQGSALVPHTFNQKKCELKVARYVIVDEVSFRVVEGKGFVELLHELQPRFRIPDRKKVASMVYDIFLVEKAKIQSVIGNQRISITTDTWTSIQNINYMVVTAHFLDSDWKLHKRIINFTKITSHHGEEIGKMVEVCLRDWGIDKVFSIVVDNASSNDTAIDYLKRRMKSENSLLFEGKYLHLRCVCLIINLIVKDGLKELNVSIKAIRNAVVFIHSSPSRLNKFREFVILAKFSSTSTVPMDVKTRWNATYKMLEVALKYRRVFERMTEEWLRFMNYFSEKDDKGKERIGPPNGDDWEISKAFVHFLKKFYDATLELSASKSPASQLLYQTMIALQVEIDRKRHDDSNPILKEVACAMKLKFDKY